MTNPTDWVPEAEDEAEDARELRIDLETAQEIHDAELLALSEPGDYY